MKKIIYISLIIIPFLLLVFLIYKNKSTTPEKSGAQNLNPTPPSQMENNIVKINDLTFSWFEIDNIDNLKLIPNFTEKFSSKDILDKESCKFISSASFYSKDSNPLGLFISNKNTISKWQENSLFDGILSVNDMATPRITRTIPSDELITAIQSGPIIKENAQFQTLKIQDDTEARRVIAAVTGENKLFFIVIYKSNSQFLGPLLADLPDSLKSFEKNTGLTFADAINLDGGAASAFTSPTVSLSEANPVGAFFCQP